MKSNQSKPTNLRPYQIELIEGLKGKTMTIASPSRHAASDYTHGQHEQAMGRIDRQLSQIPIKELKGG